MLERRVREAWSVQDAILITSIYVSHVSVGSPRARVAAGSSHYPTLARRILLRLSTAHHLLSVHLSISSQRARSAMLLYESVVHPI